MVAAREPVRITSCLVDQRIAHRTPHSPRLGQGINVPVTPSMIGSANAPTAAATPAAAHRAGRELRAARTRCEAVAADVAALPIHHGRCGGGRDRCGDRIVVRRVGQAQPAVRRPIALLRGTRGEVLNGVRRVGNTAPGGSAGFRRRPPPSRTGGPVRGPLGCGAHVPASLVYDRAGTGLSETVKPPRSAAGSCRIALCTQVIEVAGPFVLLGRSSAAPTHADSHNCTPRTSQRTSTSNGRPRRSERTFGSVCDGLSVRSCPRS